MRNIELLKDTRTLQLNLIKLGERQVEALLQEELNAERPRKSVVDRLHQRLCILRAKRERAAIFKKLK